MKPQLWRQHLCLSSQVRKQQARWSSKPKKAPGKHRIDFRPRWSQCKQVDVVCRHGRVPVDSPPAEKQQAGAKELVSQFSAGAIAKSMPVR